MEEAIRKDVNRTFPCDNLFLEVHFNLPIYIPDYIYIYIYIYIYKNIIFL